MEISTILVTGAAGFVGARFVEHCKLENLSVVSVDDPSYFSLRSEHHNVAFGEIVDRSKLFDWLLSPNRKLTGIVHLGACTDTTEFNIEYLTRVNLEFSKKLWTYAADRHIPFVYASSAATYGDGTQGYDDDEALIPKLKPLNPYGQTKQDFDLCALDSEQKGMRPPSWAGFKFFNVYGFGERHKEKMASVVLHAFDQIRATGKVRLFKSHRPDIEHGHQSRDFIFVEDVIRVLWFALNKPISRGIFNLGSGLARTYLDLVRAVFRALDKPEQIEFIDTPLEIRDKYQYFTEAKMTKLRAAGYTREFTSLERGVEQYVRKLIEVESK